MCRTLAHAMPRARAHTYTFTYSHIYINTNANRRTLFLSFSANSHAHRTIEIDVGTSQNLVTRAHLSLHEILSVSLGMCGKTMNTAAS